MTTDTYPVLIGLTGTAGVGKSTLAAMLAEQIPGTEVVGFADALKEHTHTILEDLTGVLLPPHRIGELKTTCLGPMYQGFGEFMRQNFGPNYWIDRLAEKLPPRAIVADVRHENEARWIKENDGLLVTVDGKNRRPDDMRSPDHPSETGVAACRALADISAVNVGTLADLRTQAACIARIATSLGRLRASEAAPCGR